VAVFVPICFGANNSPPFQGGVPEGRGGLFTSDAFTLSGGASERQGFKSEGRCGAAQATSPCPHARRGCALDAAKGKGLEGIKFRRQHGVCPYVLDFYCPEYRICLELDGAYHFTDEGTKTDAERDSYLESLGIEVLRFENQTVFSDPNWIVQAILYAVSLR
jgi:very-short-patch-repair endonuclease